jgi:nondiscriminating glutamyl-tRNA synthetase
MSDEEYLELVLKFIDQNTYPQEVLKKIVLLYKDQISCGSEIDEVAKLFFEKQSLSEDCVKFLKENDVTDTIKEFSSLLNELDILSVESVKECIKLAAKNTNAKGKMLFMPIRIATTMQMHGPELADTLVLLSKEKVLNNINIVLKNS